MRVVVFRGRRVATAVLSLFMLAGCIWSRIKTAEIERLRGETDVMVDATQETIEKLQ